MSSRIFWLAGSFRAAGPRVLAFVFSVALTAAGFGGEYTWKSVRIGGGGFVTGIVTGSGASGNVYARTDVGGAYRWDEATRSWTALTDWVGEKDSGFLGVDSLAIDPSAPNKIYLLVGIEYLSGGRSAVLRSEDFGKTFDVVEVTPQFRAHGNGMGRQTGERLQVDPNNGDILYCGARWGGLFKSKDAGKTWRRLDALPVTETPNGNGINIVMTDPRSERDGASQTLIVGVSRYGDNLYRSDDGGKTFAVVKGAPRDLMPQRAALSPAGKLVLAYANGAGPHPSGNASLREPVTEGGVWSYDLATGTWADLTPAGKRFPFGGIAIDPRNPERMAISTVNVWTPQENEQMRGDIVFLTEDGGATWRNDLDDGFRLDANGVAWLGDKDQSIHWAGSIAFDPADSSRLWITSGNGVYRAEDISASPTVWRAQVDGLEETVPEVAISLPDGGPLVSVIADFDGFRHTDPTRYAPIHRPRMGTTRGLANAGLYPEIMVRVGEDRMYVSEDAAKSWKLVPEMKGHMGRVAVSADGKVWIHAPQRSKTLYWSADRGNSWAPVAGLSTGNARPYADRVDPKRFYVYTGHSLARSDDGGRSFRDVAALPGNGNGVLCVVPGYEGNVWAAMNDGGLFFSEKAGEAFICLANVGYCGAVGTGKAAPDADYPTVFIWGEVAGKRGVYRSTDRGASWTRINDDAHQYGGPGNGQFIVGDQNVFGRVYMSTAGRGIVYGEPAAK